jgi:hypothetical protein
MNLAAQKIPEALDLAGWNPCKLTVFAKTGTDCPPQEQSVGSSFFVHRSPQSV